MLDFKDMNTNMKNVITVNEELIGEVQELQDILKEAISAIKQLTKALTKQ